MFEILINGKCYKVTSGVKSLLNSGNISILHRHLGDTVKKIKDGEYQIFFKESENPFVVWKGKKFFPSNWGVTASYNPMGAFHFEIDAFATEKVEKDPLTEVKGYEDLTRILNEALEQATSGKGKERHAGGKPFDKQPIMEIARMTGLAYQTGQAMKKIQESHTLLEIKGKEAAINELRGAIIYLAAAIKTIEEN